MANVTVTKRFHRDAEGHVAGTVVTEQSDFASLDEAMDWGESINACADKIDFHITNVFIDSRNFCAFDLSVVSDQIPGYDNMPWVYADPADAPSEQELFELANGPFLYTEGELSRHTIVR